MEITAIINYEEVKNSIYPQLTSAAEDLTGRPHKDLEDMAITYYVLLGSDEDSMMRALVSDRLLQAWGITLDELHSTAVSNIKPMISSMSDLLGFDDDTMPVKMIVVSNTRRIYGASSLLDHETRRKVSEIFGGDFIVLPSSVHEVICISTGSDLQELSGLVQAVNSDCVSEKEQLSNSAYYYDSEKDLLTKA